MGTRLIFSLLLGCIFFYSQFVAAWEVSCPVFVNIKSSTTVLESDVPESWQGSSRYEPRLWLDGVGMSQGKPENRVDLKPETEKIKGETRQIWDTTINSHQNSESYWVSCIYNHGQVWLSQPVPASATQCQTSSFPGQQESGESSVSVICK